MTILEFTLGIILVAMIATRLLDSLPSRPAPSPKPIPESKAQSFGYGSHEWKNIESLMSQASQAVHLKAENKRLKNLIAAIALGHPNLAIDVRNIHLEYGDRWTLVQDLSGMVYRIYIKA